MIHDSLRKDNSLKFSSIIRDIDDSDSVESSSESKIWANNVRLLAIYSKFLVTSDCCDLMVIYDFVLFRMYPNA